MVVEAAEEWNADMIVVGFARPRFWSRALLGSISDSVCKHAKCSVLVVRKPPDILRALSSTYFPRLLKTFSWLCDGNELNFPACSRLLRPKCDIAHTRFWLC
ncbi:MAG: universal stress protein [Acidobacteria bacterium]|nr:universal stress protein [Acidobacteriota bacterium]